jgi:hypothetical protein
VIQKQNLLDDPISIRKMHYLFILFDADSTLNLRKEKIYFENYSKSFRILKEYFL